jgi:hypothetical protein
VPVLAIFTGDITKDQYEALRKEVHWEDKLPPGAMLHVAAFDETGNLHVADVWESVDALNAFVGERLMPAFQKLKLNPPNVNVSPTHNINAYSAIMRYQLRSND